MDVLSPAWMCVSVCSVGKTCCFITNVHSGRLFHQKGQNCEKYDGFGSVRVAHRAWYCLSRILGETFVFSHRWRSLLGNWPAATSSRAELYVVVLRNRQQPSAAVALSLVFLLIPLLHSTSSLKVARILCTVLTLRKKKKRKLLLSPASASPLLERLILLDEHALTLALHDQDTFTLQPF